MIVSPSKLLDQKARLDMLECIEICLRRGLVDNAKEIGKASAKLKTRIETHDYKLDDKWR